MSEDEDCDDLPMITVNCSSNNSGTFAMPSAEELAQQRARELACEEQLASLRERARADESRAAECRAAECGAAGDAPAPSAAPAPLARCDSSGSEGEAALTAAVCAMRVRPRAASAPRAAQLWAALAERLPPPAPSLLHHLQGAPESAVAAHLDDVVSSVSACLAGERGAWPDEEVLCACALLVTSALALEARRRRAAARALHALLDHTASAEQVSAVAQLLAASFPAARMRLQLGDALRSGAGAGADRLAAALTGTALLRLMEPGDTHAVEVVEEVSVERLAGAAAAWRSHAAGERYCAVQLAGRALAALPGRAPRCAHAAALLQHLAPPAAAAGDAQRLQDKLKVLVGASKLKLLFRTEQ